MYVSLEPCAHFGKTPPCADRLIAEKVKRVVIACRDPFAQVDGKGIEKLLAAGVEVSTGVLQKEAAFQNRRFFTFHTKLRPYIILKWAQSADGFIGRRNERTSISHASTNVLVHRWRSEEATIMVGAETALVDDPQLNNRLLSGPSPKRILIDRNLRVPASAKMFDQSQPTYIFNYHKNEEHGNNHFIGLEKGENELQQILSVLHAENIQSVIVEGGAKLLQSFIDADLWDEARIITNQQLQLETGIAAPKLLHAGLRETTTIASDTISTFTNKNG
jgi:diaminohydroxyphosphoribosylaminopyrimidine deaminase/5-amino-6-(5-phosphoribosylamino)uracil reductase